MATRPPPYARVVRFVLWRDAEGRLYAPVSDVDDEDDNDDNEDVSLKASAGAQLVTEAYVLLPRTETRRRGAPGAHEPVLDFPLPNDVLTLTEAHAPLAAPASRVIVASVTRPRLNGAVARVEWRHAGIDLADHAAGASASLFLAWLKN